MKTLILCLLFCLMLPFAIGQSGVKTRDEFCVRYLAPPLYVLVARAARLQGTVKVEVEIGADGKVISAKGSGAHEILNRTAEENVRQWTFCSGTGVSKHTISYVYKLEGKESDHPRPTRIILELPDRIEIIGQPLKLGQNEGTITPIIFRCA